MSRCEIDIQNEIRENYYLYRKSPEESFDDEEIAEINLSSGHSKSSDEIFNQLDKTLVPLLSKYVGQKE